MKLKALMVLSLAVFAATAAEDCVKSAMVPGEAASLLPAGKKFSLVWNDEFNGDRLDDSKWSYRTNFWGRRAPWFAAPEDGAVEVKDGKIHLKIVKKPNGQFVSPQLQTGELMWDIPWDENRKGFFPLPGREKPKFVHASSASWAGGARSGCRPSSRAVPSIRRSAEWSTTSWSRSIPARPSPTASMRTATAATGSSSRRRA